MSLSGSSWIEGTKYPKDEGNVKLLDALGQSDVYCTQLLSNNIGGIEVEAAQEKEAVTIYSEQTVPNKSTSPVNILPVSTDSSSAAGIYYVWIDGDYSPHTLATQEITEDEYLAQGKKEHLLSNALR